MPTESDQKTGLHPITGFAFVRAVLDHRGDDAVETLIAAAHGGETDWLEKKAAVYPSPEHDSDFRAKTAKCPPDKLADETRFYETEILRTVATAVVALHNSRGGVVFVGVDDANDPVPFETCDPAGILEKRGLEAYVREAVLGRLFPTNGEFRCKKETWVVPAKDIGVTTKLLPYRGTKVLALLVPSLKAGRSPVLVTKTENNRSRTLLLQREAGDVGAVATRVVESAWSNSAANLSDFHGERGERFLSNTDLSGYLRTLGIPLPPPEPDNSGIPWSRRRVSRILAAAVFVSVLTSLALLAILRIGNPPKPGSSETPVVGDRPEPDPLDAIREGIRTGSIHVLTPEEAQRQVDSTLSGVRKSVEGIEHSLPCSEIAFASTNPPRISRRASPEEQAAFDAEVEARRIELVKQREEFWKRISAEETQMSPSVEAMMTTERERHDRALADPPHRIPKRTAEEIEAIAVRNT